MYNPPDGDLDPYGDEEESDLMWLWITIGVVVVIGLAVGGYFLFKKGPPDKKRALQRTDWTTSADGTRRVPPTREWYDPRRASDLFFQQDPNTQYVIGAAAVLGVGASYFGYQKYTEQPAEDLTDETDLGSSGSWFASLPGESWMWLSGVGVLVPWLFGWLNKKIALDKLFGESASEYAFRPTSRVLWEMSHRGEDGYILSGMKYFYHGLQLPFLIVWEGLKKIPCVDDWFCTPVYTFWITGPISLWNKYVFDNWNDYVYKKITSCCSGGDEEDDRRRLAEMPECRNLDHSRHRGA